MITPQFVTAGRAIFTATNTKRNTRLTFKVERPETFRGEFFALVMKGSDNENDYSYVGMVKEGSLFLRETKGSKYRAGSPEFDGLKVVLEIVAGRREAPAALDIQHAGKCGRCGRLLTVTESIESGIGPECAEKLGLTVAKVTKPVSKATAKTEAGPDGDEPMVAVTDVIQSANEPANGIPASLTQGDLRSLVDLAAKLEASREPGEDDGDPDLRNTVGF